MDLQPADFDLDAFGVDLDSLVYPNAPRKQGAGDDGAEAANGEDSIDGQSELPRELLGGDTRHQRLQYPLEFVDALTGLGGHGDDGFALEEGPFQEFMGVFGDEP
jgi:hypothetical protein